jgi:hypothetical protein
VQATLCVLALLPQLPQLPARPAALTPRSVDVVVSPVQTTLFGPSPALGYPVVMGDMNLLRLLQALRPKVLVPLLNAEIDAEGPLAPAIFNRWGRVCTEW